MWILMKISNDNVCEWTIIILLLLLMKKMTSNEWPMCGEILIMRQKMTIIIEN